jgi:hypothetical protein
VAQHENLKTEAEPNSETSCILNIKQKICNVKRHKDIVECCNEGGNQLIEVAASASSEYKVRRFLIL